MANASRNRAATRADARVRLEAAEAYLVVAKLALGDRGGAMPGVAAGVAVLAGIAASDGITAVRSSLIHRGENHRDATVLLKAATVDGASLAATFTRLIELKDEAHDGLFHVPPQRAKNAVKWAGRPRGARPPGIREVSGPPPPH